MALDLGLVEAGVRAPAEAVEGAPSCDPLRGPVGVLPRISREIAVKSSARCHRHRPSAR